MSGVSRTKDELRSYIRLLKHQEVCNYLSHAKGGLGRDLQLLTKHPWPASCPARALMPILSEQEHWIIFRDILRMLDNISALQQCTSITALNRLHDRLVVDLKQRRGRELIRDERGQPKSLPRPLIPAVENIEPIDSRMGSCHSIAYLEMFGVFGSYNNIYALVTHESQDHVVLVTNNSSLEDLQSAGIITQ